MPGWSYLGAGARVSSSNTFTSAGTYTIGTFGPSYMPGGVTAKDLLVIIPRWFTLGSGLSVVPRKPAGWATAETMAWNTTGSGGSAQRQVPIWYREADGTALDTPTIEASVSGSGSRNLLFSASMLAWSKEREAELVSHRLINATGYPPPRYRSTDAGTFIAPTDSLAIFVAADLPEGSLPPAISNVAGFTYLYADDDPSNVYTAPVMVLEQVFTTPDPAASLCRVEILQPSATARCAALVVFRLNVPSFRLDGLTWGTKRRRLGQP